MRRHKSEGGDSGDIHFFFKHLASMSVRVNGMRVCVCTCVCVCVLNGDVSNSPVTLIRDGNKPYMSFVSVRSISNTPRFNFTLEFECKISRL